MFSYDVAEIENLFLLPDVIAGFAKYKQEQCDIEEIKTRILLSSNKINNRKFLSMFHQQSMLILNHPISQLVTRKKK